MTKKPSKRRLTHPAPHKKKQKKPPKKPRPNMPAHQHQNQKNDRPSEDDDDDDDDDDEVAPTPPAPPAAPPAPPVAPPVAPAVAPLAPGAVVALEDPKLMSRLLYPNPVCLLSVAPRPRGDAGVAAEDDAPADGGDAVPEDGGHRPNVMTISWLAPINNDAAFVCSINLRRFTLRMLRSNGGRFCLSVPAKGFEKTVLAIGACSGWRNDKPAKLGFELCSPGWGVDDESAPTGGQQRPAHPPGNPFAALDEDESEAGEANDDGDGTTAATSRASAADATSPSEASAPFVAVRECIAHLQCEVTSMEEREGHAITFARVLRAHVRASHWSGKTLAPQSPEAPPILTFLGSQKFGYVRAE